MRIGIGIGNVDIRQLAAYCGGRIVGEEPYINGTASGICTDSREATDAETVFAVTVGERVDGHAYMKNAYEGGCRLFLCQRIPEEMTGCRFGAIVVSDTVAALGSIARAYAAAFHKPAVAVTGSVGKTTTKEMIAAVLSERFSVHKTKANHNSTIGLPMSMMEASGEEDISVVEMGMSGLGEIDFMTRVVAPSVACITNIGSSHLELLGTRENICRAKLEIVNGMPRDGLLIANGDEPLLRAMCPSNINVQFISFTDPSADIYVSNTCYDATGSLFDITLRGVTYRGIRLSAIGKPFVWAAAFAIAVARCFDIDMDTVRRGLLAFENAAMRQNITEHFGITMIEDCYNASPESVKAAIDVMKTLAEAQNARMVAILGDMRELGEGGANLHASVGSYYAENGGEQLITVGNVAENIAKGAISCGFSQSKTFHSDAYETEEAVRAIGDTACAILRAGDILLVKASRAIGAERILAYIKQKLSTQEKDVGTGEEKDR